MTYAEKARGSLRFERFTPIPVNQSPEYDVTAPRSCVRETVCKKQAELSFFHGLCFYTKYNNV